MKIYTQADIDTDALTGKRIAVIGYGSQGRAQALNLRDSGCDVVVGLRPNGTSWATAEADGMQLMSVPDAVRGATLVAMLAPDMVQHDIYAGIEAQLSAGTLLLFAHGFAVHYELLRPRDDLNVALISPKGPGSFVREAYERGHGLPCLVAVHRDASGETLRTALAYAGAIGGGAAGIFETTFAEETEADLFGEQAVLCGGATELVMAGYETLVEAGYQPEIAYFEVVHELKLIVDLLHSGGLEKMHKFISDTAAWGDMVSGERVIGADARAAMRAVLEDIRSGRFARDWIAEHDSGLHEFRRRRAAELGHPVEDVGRRLRERMGWLAD